MFGGKKNKWSINCPVGRVGFIAPGCGSKKWIEDRLQQVSPVGLSDYHFNSGVVGYADGWWFTSSQR